jgi:hypothetical protein
MLRILLLRTVPRRWAFIALVTMASVAQPPQARAEESPGSRLDPFRGELSAASTPPTATSAPVDEKLRASAKKPKGPILRSANEANTRGDSTVAASPAEESVFVEEEEPWDGDHTVSLLIERALANGADPSEVLAVARCETGYTFMPWRDDGGLRRGSLGEVGVGQWLPPVERNHWGRTPHWQEHHYHIELGYTIGDPQAIWWDADALAWSMGPNAPQGFRSGWSCWRVRGPWWFM